MKNVTRFSLNNRLLAFSLVGMMVCSSAVYADNLVNSAVGQYPLATVTSGEQPVQATGSADNSDNPKGAMTMTQPTLGASGQVAVTHEPDTDSANASNWASLDDNQPDKGTSPEESGTDASPEGSQADTPVNAGGNQDTDTNNTTDNTQTANPTASSTTDEEGDEHVVWHKKPINFVIPTGKERMISFPSGIATISADNQLTNDKLTLVYNDGTLYLKALQPFEPMLVIVHFKDSGERVLLHVSSTKVADDTPVDVVMGNTTATDSTASQATDTSLSYVDLLRFGVQELYAPQRLISESTDIARAPMYTKTSVTLLYGHNTQAYPRASWRGGDDFVTAVLIKNTQSHALTLDPRNLYGRWLASSFYPTNVLAARGQQGDETTLFVISDVPFGEALSATSIEGQ